MTGRILPFAFAGAVGFVVDAGLLLLLTEALGPFGGRYFSFILAVLATWAINRNFAFADRRAESRRTREFLRYLAAMLPGAVVNWLAYTLVVSMAGDGPLALTLGVAAGSLGGMTTNLVAANWLVFRAPR